MLYLPHHIPASLSLASATYSLSGWKQVDGVLRVLFLNLMPQKEVTELDIARTLQHTGVDVQLIPVKLKGQTFKTTPMSHMQAFYLDIEDLQEESFDRMIVTGAPLEQMPFEHVRYWEQLCRVMDWADKHIPRTLYVCWGAQAGLYHFYGIDKHALPSKMFGIFRQCVLRADSPLMSGLLPDFPMPNSRHTEVRRAEIAGHAAEGLHIVAESEESGVGVVATDNLKRTFIVGHLEYEPYTLHNEYHRDLAKQLPIHEPVHYYKADGSVDYSWESAALRFYTNWLVAREER